MSDAVAAGLQFSVGTIGELLLQVAFFHPR
jgi:hypothetical protein